MVVVAIFERKKTWAYLKKREAKCAQSQRARRVDARKVGSQQAEGQHGDGRDHEVEHERGGEALERRGRIGAARHGGGRAWVEGRCEI